MKLTRRRLLREVRQHVDIEEVHGFEYALGPAVELVAPCHLADGHLEVIVRQWVFEVE